MRPPAVYKSAAEKRMDAYARLGVMPDQVRLAPKITPLLKKLDGGIPMALDLLRGSESVEARKFIAVYEDVLLSKKQRDLLPLEAFCLAAGISPVRLVEVVVGAAMVQGAQLGNLIAAVAHPAIVQVAATEAQKPEGWSDREHMLKHSGFLPLPKGAQINIHQTAITQSNVAASLSAAPAPEDTIRRLVDRFNVGKDSAPAMSRPALPEAIEAEVVPAMMPGEVRDPVYIEREDD